MSRRRMVVTLMLLVAVAVALASSSQRVAASLAHLRSLSVAAVALLLAITSVQVIARVRAFALTVPGLRMRRAFVASESSVAAQSSLLGGGMVAMGLKVAMLRSWSVPPDTIAVSLMATAAASSAATWILAAVTSGVIVAAGSGSLVHAATLAGAAVALSSAGTFWWLVLWHDGLTRRITLIGAGLLSRTRRRWRRCPDVDLAGIFAAGRAAGRRLVGARGVAVLAMTVLAQLLLGCVFVVAVGLVGVDGVGVVEAFNVFALVRVLAAFAPLPGGVGVTEVGLVALLVDAGGAPSTALAAVLAFRGCTYVLPILSGATCTAGWRLTRRRASAGAPQSLPRPAVCPTQAPRALVVEPAGASTTRSPHTPLTVPCARTARSRSTAACTRARRPRSSDRPSCSRPRPSSYRTLRVKRVWRPRPGPAAPGSLR